jgi:hypothetical protein
MKICNFRELILEFVIIYLKEEKRCIIEFYEELDLIISFYNL